MKNLFILILVVIALGACKNEPNDYVTISGEITNPNSDSIVISSRALDYSKTIHLAADNTFSDTLKIEKGKYSFYDGSESTSIFLKNGFNLNITLDTKMFDETVKYSGLGSEHSSFLAQKSLLQEELLDVEKFKELDSVALDQSFAEIHTKLTDFYHANENIDTSLTNSAISDIEPMLAYYKDYIGGQIALKKEFYKGAPSPTFVDYENYDGSTTSLADLNGKYTYIDVWATWCGPCKAEIPALKEVEETYRDKNINFVSISIDDDRTHDDSWEKANTDWKAMVADKELSGIQLFAPKGWKTAFMEEYKVRSIPRFILIDPEGNVVTPDAPRPSSAELIELLEELDVK